MNRPRRALLSSMVVQSRATRNSILKCLIILCYRETMLRHLAAGLLVMVIAAASHAQVPRLLPANGQLGHLVGQQHPFPLVQINNTVVRLAPSAKIYNRENRTILHNQIPPSAPVLFVQDRAGQIVRIYLLRPDELARLQRDSKR